MEQGGKAQRETSPPPPRQPSASPRGCAVPTTCLRRACNGRGAQRAPHPPHHHHPPEGESGKGGGEKSPPPPPEDDAAGWGGRGRRVRDEPHDRARRGRAPCEPRRGDHRGCGRRIEGATEGAARLTPPPLQRDENHASCLRREGNGRKTTSPPPPHKPPPPQGWGLREGKGGQRPPLTSGGGTGGEHAAWTGQRQGPRGVPHTPAGGQGPCRVPVPCLRRAYAGGRATRAHPPPLAPTSRTHRGQRRGQRGDGEGTRGMTVASGGPPPGTPRRGGVTKGRDDRAQGGHAPCKPPRGDRRGATAGRVG